MRKPESEWFRVENTHEPIIDKEVFYRVQEQIKSRRRQTKEKATPIFAGLVKCADCGWSMRFGTNKANKTPYSYYACSYYGQFGKGNCSMHYIRYDVLYQAVLERFGRLLMSLLNSCFRMCTFLWLFVHHSKRQKFRLFQFSLVYRN